MESHPELAATRRARYALPRGLCRFRRFDLAPIPATSRPQALRLALTAWAPFPQAGYAIVMGEGEACVFAWDRAAMATRVPASRSTLMPESLLRAPLADGARLLRGIDGFEGQVWASSALQASRYWTQIPQADEWRNFLRAVGGPGALHADGPPPPITTEWLDAPYHPPRTFDELRSRAAVFEQGVVALGSLALIVATAWLAGAWWSWSDAHATAEAEWQALAPQSQKLVAARDAALAVRVNVSQLAGMTDRTPVLAMLSYLHPLIPNEVTVREVEWVNGGLRLALAVGEKTSRATILKVFSDSWFRDVEEVRDAAPGVMVLRLRPNTGPMPELAKVAMPDQELLSAPRPRAQPAPGPDPRAASAEPAPAKPAAIPAAGQPPDRAGRRARLPNAEGDDEDRPGSAASPRPTAPRPAAPRTTAPGTTAPGTTAPGTTAPRTTAPRTTAPRTPQPVTP